MWEAFIAAAASYANKESKGGGATSSRSGDIVAPVSVQVPFDSSGWNVNIGGVGLQSGGASSWLVLGALGLIAWKLLR